MFHIVGSLEDGDILELSERISSEQELMELGVKVLNLPDFKVRSALYDKRELQPATQKILRSWLKAQTSRHEAHQILYKELLKHEMNMLADLIKPSTDTTDAHVALSAERKYLNRSS